jgi:ATP-binding cassette subfamily F protein 3
VPSAAAPAAAGSSRRDERKQQAQSRAQLANRTRPLRMEIQQIDGRLEKLGAEKAELEAALVAGTVAAAEMADTGRRLNHIAAETAMLEERWLELHAEIEAISTAG